MQSNSLEKALVLGMVGSKRKQGLQKPKWLATIKAVSVRAQNKETIQFGKNGGRWSIELMII